MSQVGASNEYAINDIPDADKQSDPTLAAEQIDSPEKGVFFAVEVDTFATSGGVSTSRFATTDFVTAPDDTPPDTLYEGRVGSGDGRAASFVVTRELSTSNGFFGGVSRPRFSDVPIANNDGGLDDFLENAVDGRRVIIKAGVVVDAGVSGKTVRLDESSSVIRATGAGWEGDGDRMSLLLKDPIEELQRPITRQRYAGTGGAEGTEALEDRTKPVALGQCFNVVPALIDSGLLTYQVSIGPISELLVVKDSGLRIGNIFEVDGDYADLVATPVESGKIGVSLATGYFKLGSPPAGQITCDVRGVTLDRIYAHDIFWGDSTRWSGSYAWKATRTGPGYVNTVAGLANYILTEVAGWGHEEMNSGTISALDSLQDSIHGALCRCW